MIKKLISNILVSLLVSAQAMAGLPPTTVQGQADATAQTKFALQAPYHQKTDLGGIKALFETGSENLLANPGFENTSYASGWTIATASGAVSTSDETSGKQAATITYSSQTGGISQDVTIDANLNLSGVQVEATCWVKTTLTTVQVCARQAGTDYNCQSASSAGTWQPVTSTVLGGAQNTSVGVDIKVSASSTGNFIVDQCYVGKSRNLAQLSQAQLIGTSTWVEGVNTWNLASALTTYGAFAANASIPSPTLTGNLSQPGTRLPQVIIPSAGPGAYYVVANGEFESSTANKAGYFAISDGTNTGGDNGSLANSSITNGVSSVIGTFQYTTTQTNLTFSIQGRSVGSAASLNIGHGASATDAMVMQVFYFPSQQQTGYRMDAVPANWSGYQTVASGCSTTSSTYADPSACTSIALTQMTNRNFGTVTTAGSSLPGITFTPPRLGNYQVCANVTMFSTLGAADSIRMIDSNSVVLNPGMTVSLASASNGSTTLCGDEPVTAAGAVTVKLQLAASTSTAFIANGIASGSAAIVWNITEKDAPMGAPYYMGNVTTPATSGGEVVARANMTCSSSSAVNSQDGTFTSIGNVSSGKCSVVIPSSTFSATSYDCTVTPNGTAVTSMVGSQINNKTSTGFDLYFSSISTGSSTIAAATSITFDLVCKGPR